MRILITGSRSWSDSKTIQNAVWNASVDYINNNPDSVSCKCGHDFKLTIVHGDCPTGADRLADLLYKNAQYAMVERHPADWKKYKGAAGFRRNAEMVDLGADVCLAFLNKCTKSDHADQPPHDSHGGAHTADLAEKAGIPTKIFRDTDV